MVYGQSEPTLGDLQWDDKSVALSVRLLTVHGQK